MLGSLAKLSRLDRGYGAQGCSGLECSWPRNSPRQNRLRRQGWDLPRHRVNPPRKMCLGPHQGIRRLSWTHLQNRIDLICSRGYMTRKRGTLEESLGFPAGSRASAVPLPAVEAQIRPPKALRRRTKMVLSRETASLAAPGGPSGGALRGSRCYRTLGKARSRCHKVAQTIVCTGLGPSNNVP